MIKSAVQGRISRAVRTTSALAMATYLVVGASAAAAQSSASPFTTGYRYDDQGRQTGVILPDPDGPGGPLPFPATRNTFDGNGNLTLVETGQLSAWQDESILPSQWSGFTVTQRTRFQYDDWGRKVRTSIEGSDGATYQVTQTSYDTIFGKPQCTAIRMNPGAFGQLPGDACALGAEGTQGLDRITKNTYDQFGRVTVIKRAVGTSMEQAYATYSYAYGAFVDLDNPDSVTDANGNKTTMEYGGSVFSKISKMTFPSPTSKGQVNANDYESYQYDANGNRTQLRKRDGQVLTYGYDALGRMTSKSGATTPAVSYTYDLRGLQTSAKFTSTGRGITNGFDGFGRQSSTSNDMGGSARTLTFQYDADGNRTRLTMPDGVYFQYSYDGLDRLQHADWWASASGIVPFMQVTYDSAGRRGTINRASSYTDYSYDGISRLSSQTQRFASNIGNLNVTLAYNPASQIASETRDNNDFAFTGYVNVDRSYVTNGLNQYTAAGPATFTYDANGNLTSDGTSIYTYDSENRLIGTSSGVQLAYDPMGRLWRTSGGAFGKTDFLYDGDELVAEYDGDTGSMRRRYMFAGEDEPILWDEGSSMNCSGTKFLHTDQHGSVIALADCFGNRVQVNSYDEYGIPAAGNFTPALRQRFQYTGQAWIPELGMYHYKARIYSPTLGRFLQTDPIGYKDQMNLYSYVANDPLNMRDPKGTRIVISGSQDDRKQFIALLYKLTGVRVSEGKGGVLSTVGKRNEKMGSDVAAKSLQDGIKSETVTTMNLVNKNGSVLIDSFQTNQVDIADIAAFAKKDIRFGAAALTHVIEERQFSAKNDLSYGPAHAYALGVEASVFGANGRRDQVNLPFFTTSYLNSSGKEVASFTFQIDENGNVQ